MKRHLTALVLSGSAAMSLNNPAQAQIQAFKTPHTITAAGAVESSPLNGLIITNLGLQGVGRISASALDGVGDTFGSVSSLQVNNFTFNALAGNYSGTFLTLPDRGPNTSGLADYASRINSVNFTFTPYTGLANIGGSTIAEKKAAQNQIIFQTNVSGQVVVNTAKFAYGPTNLPTTGLDSNSTNTTLFPGFTLPANSNGTIAFDAEGLVVKPDGSGYISDEYGATIFHFDSNKHIDGVIQPPAAFLPHFAAGPVDFTSTGADPTTGRRPNQGMEGLSISPDSTKLFAMMQSGLMQDNNPNNNQNRLNARVLVYDITGGATPTAPSEEYVVQLPVLRDSGNGSAVNRVAAQSEIKVLNNHQFLVLPRDGAGLGSTTITDVYKSVIMVDTTGATNIAGTARDLQGGAVISGSAVVDPILGSNVKLLDPSITPASWTEIVNILNTTQLNKFNININSTAAAVNELTLSEKWEGMALTSALDPLHPNDYFLFLANDNDFITTDGVYTDNSGVVHPYNSSVTYNAGVGALSNDTVFQVYRLTILPEPSMLGLLGLSASMLLRPRRRK